MLQGTRFTLDKKTFGNQYAQIYFTRLQSQMSSMREKVQKAWPGVTSKPPHLMRATSCGLSRWLCRIHVSGAGDAVSSVLDVRESVEVAVIGTLYKDMKLKPSILTEYTKVTGSQDDDQTAPITFVV